MTLLLLTSLIIYVKSQSPGIRNDMYGHGGIIGTSNWYATNAGRRILMNGGNAIDAALTIQTTLSVVEPQKSGLGGGSIIMYLPSGQTEPIIIDGREEAPNNYNNKIFCKDINCFKVGKKISKTPTKMPTMEPTKMGNNTGNRRLLQTNLNQCNCDSINDVLTNETEIGTGGLTIGVPGTLASFLKLYELFDHKFSWSTGFMDAIWLSEFGFEVSSELSESIKREYNRMDINTKKLFKIDDKLVETKDVLKYNKYTQTLKDLSQGDINEVWNKFYKNQGNTKYATNIINAGVNAIVNDRYSLLTQTDFNQYSSVKRANIKSTLNKENGVYLYGAQNTGSATVMEMLGLFNNLKNGSTLDFVHGNNITSKGNSSVELLHYMRSTIDLGFADRNQYVGDCDFNNEYPICLDNDIINEYYVYDRAMTYYDTVLNNNSFPFGDISNTSNTTYDETDVYIGGGTVNGSTGFYVIDRWNNAIVVTSSLGDLFGSGVSTSDGIILNNALKDFDRFGNGINSPQGNKKNRTTSTNGNTVQGGKRPRSDMVPLIATNIKNGKILGLFASSSSIAGISTSFQTIARTLILQPNKLIPYTYEPIMLPRVYSFNNGTILYNVNEWFNVNNSNNISLFEEELMDRGYDIENITNLYSGQANVLTYHWDGVEMQFGSVDKTRDVSSSVFIRYYGWYSIYLESDTYKITCIVTFTFLGLCCCCVFLLCCIALDDDEYENKSGDYYNPNYKQITTTTHVTTTKHKNTKTNKNNNKKYPAGSYEYNKQKELEKKAFIKQQKEIEKLIEIENKKKQQPIKTQNSFYLPMNKPTYITPISQQQYIQSQPQYIQIQPQYIQTQPQIINNNNQQQQQQQVRYIQAKPQIIQ